MREILKRCLAGMMAMFLVLTSFTTYVQADDGTEDVPEPVTPVTYKVELVNDEVSTLKFLDKEELSASFEAGSEVSFSVSLKEGYSLEKVEAKTGETEIEVVASENSYSFTMPEGSVGVKALYKEEKTIRRRNSLLVKKVIHLCKCGEVEVNSTCYQITSENDVFYVVVSRREPKRTLKCYPAKLYEYVE